MPPDLHGEVQLGLGDMTTLPGVAAVQPAADSCGHVPGQHAQRAQRARHA